MQSDGSSSRKDGEGVVRTPKKASVQGNLQKMEDAQHKVLNGDEIELPSTAIARLTLRTTNNLRMWYLRHNSARSSQRRSEQDQIKEIQRGRMLFAQAFTGTPMVMVTSSGLRPEDNDERKVPCILEQLNITVGVDTSNRHGNMFRITLEYGGGLGLIRWEVLRGYRDILYLRGKLLSHKKLRSRGPKLPKLPSLAAFDLLDLSKNPMFHRKGRGDSDSDESDYGDLGYQSGDEDGEEISEVSSEQQELQEQREQDREHGHPSNNDDAGSVSSHDKKAHEQRLRYAKAVESWLNRVKDVYRLRSDRNDFMQFLEMSHLGLKLAPEYSFHGKEGVVVVRSPASDMGWRISHLQPHGFIDMFERHTKKWVLIRDSYIVIVDNIYSTFIREVFLVDPYFKLAHVHEKVRRTMEEYGIEGSGQGQLVHAIDEAPNVQRSTPAKSVFIHLQNNEREMKLAARSEREMRRWQASILQMKALTPWSKKNRFGSFAPVRKNVFGQWFVDGRDYFWVLSDALENARDTIYILDWWLSPELYLRRPPEGNQKWRLDRVLRRKAEQGVKIFVIVYRNVNAAIPIDSLWTKHSLLGLHKNIHIMRSPNQLKNQSALFWAHHEKLCVIDGTIAFNGGVDLCFGRWDNWDHPLVDDAPTPFLPENPTEEEWKRPTQIFPGKDYNNARVKDFYFLDKPWDETHDRNHVPRMPWHDVHQMVLGQPARDLCRHFVQRWNYVVRQKIPSRPTPLLLPPPDFSQEDLERLQLTGTCEYQVLRSSGEWSLGLKEHEQSIQNAYLKLIEESEHLVYIENQFFITSTKVDGILIENQIGNALVQRIVRAHQNGETWKAFIVIPLMPGFEADVDSEKASSVRIICQCQFNSISRGPNSIFYRLEQMGIRPDQYINFMSLRKWDKFSDTAESPNGGRLVTELLYIHGKCMVVDDRVAIIGSANINERSMRGIRDSEIAVCVRDTKVVESRMGGKPFKASKFAHSLRVRLMREHLGVDIDKLEIVERYMNALENTARATMSSRATSQATSRNLSQPASPRSEAAPKIHSQSDEDFPEWLFPDLHSFNWYAGTNVNKGIHDSKKLSRDARIWKNKEHCADVEGDGYDHWKKRMDQEIHVMDRQRMAAEPDAEMEKQGREIMSELLKDRKIKSIDQFKRLFYSNFTGQDIMRPLVRASERPLPRVDEEGMRAIHCENIPVDPWAFDDPVDDRFINDLFLAVAERNTLIYRLVFRCQPDDEVETWKDYKTYAAHQERFYEKQREDGGPNALRKSGKHAPERVNKLVLSGDIKQTDPLFIQQQIMNASNWISNDLIQGDPLKLQQQFANASNWIGDRIRDVGEVGPLNGQFGGQIQAANTTSEASEASEATQQATQQAPPDLQVSPHPPVESVEKHHHLRFKDPEPLSKDRADDLKIREEGLNPGTEFESTGKTSNTRQADNTGPADFASFKPARKWGHFDHVLDAQVAEDILGGITGHLVVFPTEWLNRELDSGNWNFQLDRMAPLEIYD